MSRIRVRAHTGGLTPAETLVLLAHVSRRGPVTVEGVTGVVTMAVTDDAHHVVVTLTHA